MRFAISNVRFAIERHLRFPICDLRLGIGTSNRKSKIANGMNRKLAVEMETRVMTDTVGDQARAQALLEASRAISSSLDLDEALRLIVREAAAISEAPAVRLFLLDESGRI